MKSAKKIYTADRAFITFNGKSIVPVADVTLTVESKPKPRKKK